MLIRQWRPGALVGLLAAVLGMSLLVAPKAPAAKLPTSGFPCSEKDTKKPIQTKKMKAQGLSLICVLDESEHGHEESQPSKKHSHKKRSHKDKRPFKWAWFSPPLPAIPNEDFLVHPNIQSLATVDLVKVLNEPYVKDEAEPCKLNGLDVDAGSNASYGNPGLWGRNAEGYSPTFGTVTIGVVISVPTDYVLLQGGMQANRAGNSVTYRALKARAVNLEEYLNSYFLEQSYGKLNVEFRYFPRILRGNRSIEEMRSNTWHTPAVLAYNVANQIPDTFWQSDFASVDAIWSLIVDKPGALAVRAFREIEGENDEIIELETPIGTFKTTLQSGKPLSGNHDKPLIAHEIFHTLRLPDSYQRGSNPTTTRMAGRIGRGGSGYTTSGILGWERYISRWLTDRNVACLTLGSLEYQRKADQEGATVLLRPIQEPTVTESEKKLAIIPFDSGLRGVVVESWRPIGSDAANALDGEQSTGQSGALIYIINTETNNGLNVNSVETDWPVIDSPVTLYRDQLWSINESAFPRQLSGCEEGHNSLCNNLMQDLVRRQAFLREVGETKKIPMGNRHMQGLCGELNPWSPTYTQDIDDDLQGTEPHLALTLVSTSVDSDTVRAEITCD